MVSRHKFKKDQKISINTSLSLGNQPQPLSRSFSELCDTLHREQQITLHLAHNVKISVHGHSCNADLPKFYALVHGRRAPTSSIQYK